MRRHRLVIVVVVVLALVAAAYGVGALVATLSAGDPSRPQGSPDGPPSIPTVVRTAYVQAAGAIRTDEPACGGMTWTLLAGIGAVESRHAAGHTVGATGEVTPAIVGPRLDGSGVGGNTTPVLDTDGGALDGDGQYDRAVGPMQFLPETWTAYARDGNGDGRADPQNIFDAALTAAVYLCGPQPTDLSDPAQLAAAITRYNESSEYVDRVVGLARAYAATG